MNNDPTSRRLGMFQPAKSVFLIRVVEQMARGGFSLGCLATVLSPGRDSEAIAVFSFLWRSSKVETHLKFMEVRLFDQH